MLNDPSADGPQGTLFPFPVPETVFLELRRIEQRVLRIAPELSKEQCLALLRELALTELALDHIEASVLASPVYKARQEWQASTLMDELKRSVAGQVDAKSRIRRKRA